MKDRSKQINLRQIIKALLLGTIVSDSDVNGLFGWLTCPQPSAPVSPINLDKLTEGTWYEIMRDASMEDQM